MLRNINHRIFLPFRFQRQTDVNQDFRGMMLPPKKGCNGTFGHPRPNEKGPTELRLGVDALKEAHAGRCCFDMFGNRISAV